VINCDAPSGAPRTPPPGRSADETVLVYDPGGDTRLMGAAEVVSQSRLGSHDHASTVARDTSA
jgi:hypothetical protein